MATIVKWRPQARKDLGAIETYYEDVVPEYADVFVEEVLEKARKLEDFPRMGRIVSEIGNEAIRELIHRSYRIIYIVDAEDQQAEVLTVFHSARQFGGLDSPEE